MDELGLGSIKQLLNLNVGYFGVGVAGVPTTLFERTSV